MRVGVKVCMWFWIILRLNSDGVNAWKSRKDRKEMDRQIQKYIIAYAFIYPIIHSVFICLL